MKFWIIWLVVPLWAGPLAALAQEDDIPEVSGFRVPEFDEQGNKKSEMTGAFARMNSDGVFEITELRIEFYEEDKVTVVVEAPKCLYDQKNGTAKSDSSVRMARENMLVTGEGFTYDRVGGRFEIFHNAKVVFKGVEKQMKVGGQ